MGNIVPAVPTVSYTKKQALNKVKLSDHFTVDEFACKHCLRTKKDLDIVLHIDPKLIALMEKLRIGINLPMNISNGYRCPQHNAEVHGASQSRHIFGMACDFSCYGKLNGITVLDQAYKIFPRMGFYQSSIDGHCFMHVDTDPKRLFWLSRLVNGSNSYQYFQTMDAMKAAMKADTKISWYHLVI